LKRKKNFKQAVDRTITRAGCSFQ